MIKVWSDDAWNGILIEFFQVRFISKELNFLFGRIFATLFPDTAHIVEGLPFFVGKDFEFHSANP